ncbi:MAG: TRAP transporter small permease subunit [Methylobacterium sp.]|nr:TRAP transporter small permease subunit [Methylobacterium sp.]MCA3619202.1 TRAP transporter small permease subunit [Methylobacterium sp.]MCA3622516.1 TRAP transporter small permease subunit [Methylobacterium sp.]
MQSLSSRVAHLVTILCGVLVAVMVLIMISDVASRNLFAISVTSSAEVAILLQVYIAFLAAGVGVQRGLHFVVFSETGRYPPRLAYLAALAVRATICLFAAFAGYFGLRLGLAQMTQLSASLQIPYGYFYFALPLGCALMLFFALAEPLRPDKAGSSSLEVV